MATRTLTIPTQFADCIRKSPTELTTIPGLAMTPSEVKDLTDRGISVSTQISATQTTSSELENGFFVEPMFRRSIDVNDLWNLQRSTQSKIMETHKRNKQTYG